MKKLNMETQKLNTLVDIRMIPTSGIDLSLAATALEKQALAERFEVPVVRDLAVKGRLFWEEDNIVFEGVLQAEMERICVVTMNQFTEKMTDPFRLVFSESPQADVAELDIEADIVSPIKQGKVNLGEVLAEEFGLALNPFPRQEQVFFEYYDESEEKCSESPFAVLKKLQK